MILQVTGVEALKSFSGNFVTPYQPSCSADTLEGVERRVSALRQQLNDAETELERLRRGKTKI